MYRALNRVELSSAYVYWVSNNNLFQVPAIERMLKRNEKKNKLPAGAVRFGFLGKPSAPKNVFGSAEEVADMEKPYVSQKEKEGRNIRKLERR